MTRQPVLCAAVIGTVFLSPQLTRPSAQVSGVPVCLHDAAERELDRKRRAEALGLAKTVNQAQGTAAERTRIYLPLSKLGKLPPAPRGFELRVYTDGTGYVLSLKDTLDPCKYAIFSDESGVIYEKTPLAAPILATGS
jgi:hypothetical protein